MKHSFVTIKLVLFGLLSFVWVLFLSLINSKQQYRLINGFIPSNSKSPLALSQQTINRELKGKKRVTFRLDDNNEMNDKKIKVIQYESLKLNFTNDNSHVLSIEFGNNSDFKYIPQLLVFCENENLTKKVLTDSLLIIWSNEKEKNTLPKKKITPIYM